VDQKEIKEHQVYLMKHEEVDLTSSQEETKAPVKPDESKNILIVPDLD
jgi:capsular polysaccharide biosynthesis protein